LEIVTVVLTQHPNRFPDARHSRIISRNNRCQEIQGLSFSVQVPARNISVESLDKKFPPKILIMDAGLE